MRIANDAELVAAVPYFRAGNWRGVFVTAKLSEETHPHGEWVTADMADLDATSWRWGHYFSDQSSALADMYDRANVARVPAELLAQQAQVGKVRDDYSDGATFTRDGVTYPMDRDGGWTGTDDQGNTYTRR